VTQEIVQLVQDMREVMAPYTALKLKDTKKNQLKDFLSVAPTLGVTHFHVFSQTQMGTNLRLVRVPHGPTLTFRVSNYSLMRDIVNIQKRPHSHGPEFLAPPLVVLNNFSGDEHYKQIMAAMFQNMFPAINVRTVKLAECRRVVLLNFNSETEEIEFRHYVVNASPVGLTKSVKRIIKAKIPNMNKLADIADYVEGDLGGMSSDSEAEDTPETRVTLSQDFKGRGNRRAHKSALRLKELGPRMSLKLLKIEEEFCDGKVLYHSLVSRTEEEADELQQKKQEKMAAKEQRRRQQEANVAVKEEKKQAKKERKQLKKQKREGGDDMDEEDDSEEDMDEDEEDEDEDDDEGNDSGYDAAWETVDPNEKAKQEAIQQLKQGGKRKKGGRD